METTEAELVLTEREMEIKRSKDAIKDAENAIALLKDLNELKSNQAFQNIIMKKYTIAEPQRILANLTTANFLTREERLDYVDEITAISKLQGFFSAIESRGHNADRVIEAEQYRIQSLEDEGE